MQARLNGVGVMQRMRRGGAKYKTSWLQFCAKDQICAAEARKGLKSHVYFSVSQNHGHYNNHGVNHHHSSF